MVDQQGTLHRHFAVEDESEIGSVLLGRSIFVKFHNKSVTANTEGKFLGDLGFAKGDGLCRIPFRDSDKGLESEERPDDSSHQDQKDAEMDQVDPEVGMATFLGIDISSPFPPLSFPPS